MTSTAPEVSVSAKIWCADETLRMAVEMLANKRGIPTIDALLEFVKSPVYDALYDVSTGMWGEGPTMLLDDLEHHVSDSAGE